MDGSALVKQAMVLRFYPSPEQVKQMVAWMTATHAGGNPCARTPIPRHNNAKWQGISSSGQGPTRDDCPITTSY